MTIPDTAIEAAARAEYNALLPHNACACHFSWETLADWSREKRIKTMAAALSAAYPLMEAQAKAEALASLTAEGLLDTRAGLALAHDSWGQGASTMLDTCNNSLAGAPWEKPGSPYATPLLRMIKAANVERKDS